MEGGRGRGRGGRGGRGRGGVRGRGGGGGRSSGFIKSDPDAPRISSEVQIFVEGLPVGAKVPELVQYFSTVGEIKVDRMSRQPRVHLYKDKQTGQVSSAPLLDTYHSCVLQPTGEATITYTDTQAQLTALQTYNNQMYQGHPIQVSPSIVKAHMAKPGPRGGRGAGRGGGGVPNYTIT